MTIACGFSRINSLRYAKKICPQTSILRGKWKGAFPKVVLERGVRAAVAV
jgi:hypothetical protein